MRNDKGVFFIASKNAREALQIAILIRVSNNPGLEG